MTDDETNPIAGLDLDAWTAPPPPAGLADRAIARAAATDEAIAVVQRRRRVKRRWWLAGGLTGALAAASIALLVIPHGSPDPGSGSGALVAASPQQLALGGAVANLDPGADLTWQRSGDAIHVAQRAGSVTWKIDHDHLSLDVGAAVASAVSIDASNATFRVETKMNLMDTRIVGVTAATAAAVALVTVIVYDGHVKVSGAGQTIVVERGGTVEVAPGEAPKKLDNVAGVPVVTAVLPAVPPSPAPSSEPGPELIVPIGEKVTIHDPKGRIRVAIDLQCPGSKDLGWPGGEPNQAMTPGESYFTSTCNGIDRHATIKIVQDPGFGVVTAPVDAAIGTDLLHVMGAAVPARAQVTIGGTVVATQNNTPWAIDVPYRDVLAVRIDAGLDDIHYYIRRMTPPMHHTPEVTIRAGESVTIHDPTGSVHVQETCGAIGDHGKPVSSVVDGLVAPMTLGSHPYTVTCLPSGEMKHGTVTVVADDGSAIGSVDPIAEWTPPFAIGGSFTTPGTTVDIQGLAASRVDGSAEGWFTAKRVQPEAPGVLAVRFDVPQKGTHIVVVRKAHFMYPGDADIDEEMRKYDAALNACVKHHTPFQGVSFNVQADGTVHEIRTTVDDAASEACIVDLMQKQRFPKQNRMRYITYHLDSGCDVKSLVTAGDDFASRGEWATALVRYDSAIDCTPDEHTLQLGFMAACNAHNVKFAGHYWKRLLHDSRTKLLQLCIRNGITEDQLTE